MTRPFTQIVVIHIILQLLLYVDTAPYSVQDLKSLFANPIKDFVKLFSQENSQKPSVSVDNSEKGKGELESMIDVPLNVRNTCQNGGEKDIDGICRTPF